MSNSSKRASRGAPAQRARIWCWRKRVSREMQEDWITRIENEPRISWAITDKPGNVRALLTAFCPDRQTAFNLVRKWKGRAQAIRNDKWISAVAAPPLIIGAALRIEHEASRGRGKEGIPTLRIPHGLAFGSGEHATTAMMLGALTRCPPTRQTRVLDLGTGSGILALAARRLGAGKIVATDFDATAIATARRNEEINFPDAAIRWHCADVMKLAAKAQFHLVLANLFSGILCKTATRISSSVTPGGLLWLSGILRSQQEEVTASFASSGLQLERIVRRGKWILLQWKRPELPTSKPAD